MLGPQRAVREGLRHFMAPNSLQKVLYVIFLVVNPYDLETQTPHVNIITPFH